jgi:tRNA threonylcarbamoyladenosine biosynthesis protein TsaE
MKKVTKSIKETHKLAEKLIKDISESKPDKAVVVALVGELGSGKTTFTQGFAKALGIEEYVTSPTFVLMKNYRLKGDLHKILVHVDAYRLEKPKDLIELGWSEVVANPLNIVLIEWADRIKDILPENYYLVTFSHKSEKERAIDIKLVK